MKIYDETEPLNVDFPLRMSKIWLRKREYSIPHYHKHHYFEITCVMNGQGAVFANDQKYLLTAGDVVLFNVDEVHGWKVKEDMRIFEMVFSEELIFDNLSLFDYEYLKIFHMSGNPLVNKISGSEIYAKKIYGVMEDIYNEWIHNEPERKLMMKAFVLRILTMLTRHYGGSVENLIQCREKNEKMSRLKNVIEFVASHYDQKITLNQAAAKVYMSPNYFSNYFKKVMGENFSTYVIKVRIHKAKEMLDNEDCNVLEVSGRCGFHNVSNFYRAYKRVVGETPTKNKRQR